MFCHNQKFESGRSTRSNLKIKEVASRRRKDWCERVLLVGRTIEKPIKGSPGLGGQLVAASYTTTLHASKKASGISWPKVELFLCHATTESVRAEEFYFSPVGRVSGDDHAGYAILRFLRGIPHRPTLRVGRPAFSCNLPPRGWTYVSSAKASSTFSSWPSTFTRFQTLATRPAASIKKVLRWMPIDFFPYIFFSRQAPYLSAIL